MLTHHDDLGSRESLDYIFECYFNEKHDKSNKRLVICDKSLSIEKFQINNGKVYRQLSDHYGLSCDFVYRGWKYFLFR